MMKEEFNFTLEENNKIILSKFIMNLFDRFSSLHTINLFKNDISLIEKGKVKERKKLINVSTAFKYSSFYCYCHGNKVQTYEDEDEFVSLKNNVLLNTIRDSVPITFYLKDCDKRITYQEFENNILSQIKQYDDYIDFIFGEKKTLTFSKNKISRDVNDFLGSFIISKQYAQKFNIELPLTHNLSKKCVKV